MLSFQTRSQEDRPLLHDSDPIDVARRRFAGKKVTVVGLAREGVSLVRFLASVGAEVTANDRAPEASLAGALRQIAGLPVNVVAGGHPHELFARADAVFVSPGVPRELEALAAAREQGVPVSSETQLFFELCRGRIVGITGSSGKTTTTALVGEMFREAGMPMHLGGNIGLPLLERVGEIGRDDWVVLELSSFQLETLPYSPPVAAILNITPNHLDRHASMEAYTAAKVNLVRHQKAGDRAVLNADDRGSSAVATVEPPIWFSLERPVRGAHVDAGRVVISVGSHPEEVCSLDDIRLRGRHNLANVAAAVAIAFAAGIPVPAMLEAIRRFTGVPHRLEVVAELDGVTYVNDSIATSPERAIAALRAFDQPVVLIAGGRNKRLPLEEWAGVICRRAKAVVLMGEAADAIEAAVRACGEITPPMLRATGLDEAVARARTLAEPGDMVLLAPGGTSFDMFKDFEERGERFRMVVRRLGGGTARGDRE